jgi:hypothetical protein
LKLLLCLFQMMMSLPSSPTVLNPFLFSGPSHFDSLLLALVISLISILMSKLHLDISFRAKNIFFFRTKFSLSNLIFWSHLRISKRLEDKSLFLLVKTLTCVSMILYFKFIIILRLG